MQSHPDTAAIDALRERLTAQLDEELPLEELAEMPTDITLRDISDAFGMRPDTLATALRREMIRLEIIDELVFNPHNRCFMRNSVGYLLVWQVWPAVEIAWEVYHRSMHRASHVTVIRLADAR